MYQRPWFREFSGLLSYCQIWAVNKLRCKLHLTTQTGLAQESAWCSGTDMNKLLRTPH